MAALPIPPAGLRSFSDRENLDTLPLLLVVISVQLIDVPGQPWCL